MVVPGRDVGNHHLCGYIVWLGTTQGPLLQCGLLFHGEWHEVSFQQLNNSDILCVGTEPIGSVAHGGLLLLYPDGHVAALLQQLGSAVGGLRPHFPQPVRRTAVIRHAALYVIVENFGAADPDPYHHGIRFEVKGLTLGPDLSPYSCATNLNFMASTSNSNGYDCFEYRKIHLTFYSTILIAINSACKIANDGANLC